MPIRIDILQLSIQSIALWTIEMVWFHDTKYPVQSSYNSQAMNSTISFADVYEILTKFKTGKQICLIKLCWYLVWIKKSMNVLHLFARSLENLINEFYISEVGILWFLDPSFLVPFAESDRLQLAVILQSTGSDKRWFHPRIFQQGRWDKKIRRCWWIRKIFYFF
jgi:hypothetical protein